MPCSGAVAASSNSRNVRARGERAHDEVEITRLAGVVEARPAIRQHAAEVLRVARARAEVDRCRGEAVARDDGQQSLHVDRVRAPFESVQQDEVKWSTG